MSTIYLAFTTIVNNWPAYAVALLPFGFVFGIAGHIFTLFGALLAGSSWAPARALGHTFELIGGLLNSVYAHWGQFFAAIGKFVADIKALLPKGPGGGAAAVGAFAIVFCMSMTTGCSSAQLAKDVTTIVSVTAKASQWTSNAALWLDRGESLEQAFFRAAPNAATQSAIESKLDDARALLVAITETVAGTKDLTDLDVVDAFKNFVAAAIEIDQLLKDAGIIRSTTAATSSAVSPPPLELPLCVQAAKGQS